MTWRVRTVCLVAIRPAFVVGVVMSAWGGWGTPHGRVTAQAVADAAERSVWDGIYSKEQAASGKESFAERCASCHESNGDHMAVPLVGPDFMAAWQGKKVRALYSRIISTMPADDPGTLQEKTVVDIVAFLLEANGFPSGARAIGRADELNTTTFRKP